MFLPPQVWVIKRELLWVPFFGWGLAMMSPIAIDRSAGMKALKQTLEQGRERLAQGFWIVIFPEGTAFPPGERGTVSARRRLARGPDRRAGGADRAQRRPSSGRATLS